MMIALLVALLAVVNSSNNTVSYACDGSTAVYTVNYPYLAYTDLVVTSTTAGGAVTTLVYTTDYTVNLTSTSSTATLTLNLPATKCPSGNTLKITRTLAFTQPTSFKAQTNYNQNLHETAYDRLVMEIQQLNALYTNPPATVLPANVVAKLNGIRFADQFANIQAAITDAGTTGAVLIPSTYSATDTFSNTNGIPIIDLRAGAMSYRSYVTSDDFGAVGDGSTDDAGKLQSALNSLPATGGTLVLRPGKNFKILTQLSITKPYTRVVGYGAKITQAGTLQRGFSIAAVGVVIEGVYLYNANGASEWSGGGGATNARGIYFDTGSDNGKAINCKVENWGWSGITVYQSSRVEVLGNEVIGIGTAGGLVNGSNNNLGIEFYLVGTGYTGGRIIGNTVHDLAQGIFVGDSWENLVIANNTIYNIIGQHGMYLDALRNVTISGNSVETTGQNGIKLQVQASTPAPPAGDGINISVTGNVVKGTGAAGIIVLAASAGLSPYFYNVAIVGNSVQDSGSTGIDLDHADGWLIASNTIRNAGTIGILTRSETKNGRIVNNFIQNTQQTAIYVQEVSTSYKTIIEGNSIDSPCLSGTGASDLRDVFYLSVGAWILKNNVVSNTGSCANNVFTHASALVTLGKNYIPATLNNSVAGTVADELTVFAAPANGATITPDCQSTAHLYVTVANATWTAGAPTNIDSTDFIAITVSNTSGGAITTTWNAIYKLTAWTEPTNGNQVTITFRRNSAAVKWYEVSRTGQVPN